MRADVMVHLKADVMVHMKANVMNQGVEVLVHIRPIVMIPEVL